MILKKNATPLCYPKISTNKNVKAFFKPATGGNVFFDFLKLKMKRTFVLSCTDQNSFNFNFSFWQLFFDV